MSEQAATGKEDPTPPSPDERLRSTGDEPYRRLVDSIRDHAIFMLDAQGRVASWNTGAQLIKGYAAEEIVGQPFARFYTPEAIAAGSPVEALRRAAAQGRLEDEGWRLRKDGSTFWAHCVVEPVVDAGSLRGYAVVVRDLGGQHRLAELERAGARMNEFIAMLGHELRNPLTPICNAVLYMKLQGPLSPELERVQVVIERQSEHLVRLVDELLDVGRFVTGKVPLKPQVLDLREIVRACVDAVRAQAAAARLSLVLVDETASALQLSGDSTRLAQALGNVIGNALRSTDSGGEIRVEVEGLEGNAVVRVDDTGRGLAPDSLERIFGMFAQEDGDPRPAGRPGLGLGIGLALARRIAELHGGTLTAASPGLGLGSTFTFSLPIAAALLRAQGGLALPQGPPHRVLVVDDNRDVADSTVQLLEALGQTARAAYGAEEAVAVARQFRPEVVLLDINMPDGSGFSVMESLRAEFGTAVYIAAMTGYYAGQPPPRRGNHADFDANLAKPLGPARLCELLAELAPPSR
jgi:PAS domain S-box-containing protein